MPRILLYDDGTTNAIFFGADQDAATKVLTAKTLVLPQNKIFNLPDPVVIPPSVLVSLGGDEYRFDPSGTGPDPKNGFAFTAEFLAADLASFQFFGLSFEMAGSISAQIAITVPAPGSPPSEFPFAAIRACGSVAIGGVSETLCFEVAIDQLPLDLKAALPGLRLRLPDLGFSVPPLSLPWVFPAIPLPPYKLSGVSLSLDPLPVTVSVKSIDVDVAASNGVARTTIDFRQIRVAGTVGAIEGDLQVVLLGGAISKPDCSFRLYQPDFEHAIVLAFSDWQISPGCLGLAWNDPHLNQWLNLLVPDIAGFIAPASAEVALRVLWEHGLREVRLDFKVGNNPLTIPLPGFEIDFPPVNFLSLIGYPDRGDGPPRIMFTASIPGGQQLVAHSTFTWMRASGSREMHKAADNSAKEFIRFTAKTKGSLANGEAPWPDVKIGYADDVMDPEPEPDPDFDFGPDSALSLVMLDIPLGDGKPQYFRQLNTPLTFLTPAGNLPYNFDPTEVSTQSIRLGQDWEDPTLIVNGCDLAHPENQTPFKLPFLASSSQGIELKVLKVNFQKDNGDPFFNVKLNATVTVGSLQLATTLDVEFHYESFAFKVVDKEGIKLKCPAPLSDTFLGLKWRFLGPNRKESDFDFLRLVIDGSNFQLRQEPGTVIEADYTEATADGSAITFSISDFLIGPKGIDLSAAVTNKPAKLAGIDTEFSFREGSFQIRQNQITGFSLTGSGPLPPALVGSATAEISLQFDQVDGGLTLISGGARLEGKNLLKCQGTRFDFTVDGLGLKFVRDSGRYHLYFTITGTAKYTPLDSDNSSGPLAWLPKVEMKLMECPLTGDARLISQHVKFLVEMPKKIEFDFLGCFQFELRGIGFVPQARMFDANASAMQLSGQIKFADGGGDALEAKIDVHDLYVGLPAPGSLIPRLYCKELAVKLKSGEAFELDGYVDFLNDEVVDGVLVNGFRGGGVVTIKGLPKLAAAFSFVRVRADGESGWKRAWFIYLEIREISLQIPVVELFIREIGLGFGYRYTLASIKESDNLNDPKALIQKLSTLSLSQGDLAKQSQWRIDAGGSEARWTVVFRGMISQTSASASPLDWKPAAEQNLACLFLMDVVVALRSDLTFLMTARAWLSTNYWEYDNDQPSGIRNAPLLSGFVLLSPRQKRFLAHVNSNRNAKFGKLPPLGFLQDVLASCYFPATILLEPGLLQYELGWPNQLQWSAALGPLNASFRGGTLFRLSTTELVIGNSFEARGTLQLQAGIDLGFIGAQLTALASVAYGARYIGVISFQDPLGSSAFYGVAGIDIQVTVSIAFWIRIDLGWFGSITLRFGFSFAIAITAAVQVGITFRADIPAGVRGTATVSLSVMGHGLHFNICVGINDTAVQLAQSLTQRFLDVGLEASDVSPIPGEPNTAPAASPAVAPAGDSSVAHANVTPQFGQPAIAGPQAELSTGPDEQNEASRAQDPVEEPAEADAQPGPPPPPHIFETPDYSIFHIPQTLQSNTTGYDLLLLIPSAKRKSDKPGFLPVPPAENLAVNQDFQWDLPVDTMNLDYFDATNNTWKSLQGLSWSWAANWDKPIATGATKSGDAPKPLKITPRNFLRYAYHVNLPTTKPSDNPQGAFDSVTPIEDPDWRQQDTDQTEDPRVYNPSDSAYEASVRGALDQVESAKFKHDPNAPYDQKLAAAFSHSTSIYAPGGVIDNDNQVLEEQAVQTRSSVIQTLISDLQDFALSPANFAKKDPDTQLSRLDQSLAFQMGLVFGTKNPALRWLSTGAAGTIHQRNTTTSPNVDTSGPGGQVSVFNLPETRFDQHVPHFERVRHYADASSIWITWDLEWDWTGSWQGRRPAGPNQDDPEHHLQNYVVRRRCLDGGDSGTEFTVRPTDILHRECKFDDQGKPMAGPDDKPLYRLRSRFQINDHFTNETEQDLADLPQNGKSYLYTITPVDISGSPSPRPLTVVATRKSTVAPLLPSDIEFKVQYTLPANMPQPVPTPVVQKVAQLVVSWTEPPFNSAGPTVAPDHNQTRLIFRRESTEPIGSYGLDAVARGSRADGLPTTNARPLSTDVIVSLKAPDPKQPNQVVLAPSDLPAQVLSNGAWRPDSWRVFLQRASRKGIRTALAPVQIVLEFDSSTGLAPAVKRPGSLEFVAQPVRFSFLPPEDERAVTDLARVPMPSPDSWKFNPDSIGNIAFKTHPNGSRAVQFEWNQASTRRDSYPPEIHCGYRVFEYDLDAHTAGPIAQIGQDFTDRLRPIADVELLSPADAALTPADTLATGKWEAWYPARVRQHDIARNLATHTDYIPWFSWRESAVIWPASSFAGKDLFDATTGARVAKYHPLLQRLVDALSALTDDKNKPLYVVDLAPAPAAKPATLADFLRATSANVDPYGWNILQRCGLSICFCLRDKNTGASKPGNLTLRKIQDFLSSTDLQGLESHLHIEYLVQPGKSIRVADGNLSPDKDLLDIVQVSLRPVVRQVYRYGSVTLNADPGSTQLTVEMNGESYCTVLTSPSPTGYELRFDKDGKISVDVPVSKTLQILIRAERPEKIRIKDANGNVLPFVECRPGDQDSTYTITAPAGQSAQIDITMPQGSACTVVDLTSYTQLAALSQSGSFHLKIPAGGIGKFLVRSSQLETISVSGQARTLQPLSRQVPALGGYFTVDAAAWVDRYTKALGDQWTLIWRYLCSLNSSDPKQPRIDAPNLTDEKTAAANVALVLSWMQRFLDHGFCEKAGGPWVATAYQRPVSPVASVPDSAGRVTFYHLITDPWGHTFRYYVRPKGRYDDLWHSLEKICPPADTNPVDPRLIGTDGKPEPGGLDVVLDRLKEVAPPLILSSKRIDLNSDVGSPAKPGTVWEVIVAKHPEQILIERNQTLVRHLAYRQIAVTLMRRFAYATELANFQKAAGAITIAPALGDRQLDLLPGPYPQPDTLDLTKEANIRSIDLPLRIGDLSRGALVYQWRGLPYFYQQRFIAAAQTTQKVSDPVEVLQSDFEYVSPSPYAETDGIVDEKGVRRRLVRIRLSNHWECLPDSAQTQWTIEDPREDQGPGRKYSSLPDVHVVYQLTFTSVGGATETVAECRFDTDYGVKPISTSFQAEKAGLVTLTTPGYKQAAYFLLMLLKGDFSRADRNDTLFPSIPEFAAINLWRVTAASGDAAAEFLARWYAVRVISSPDGLKAKPGLKSKVSFVPSDRLILQWEALDSNPLPALNTLIEKTSDPDMKAALSAMAADLQKPGAKFSIQTAPLPFTARLPVDLVLPGSLQFQLDHLLWRGTVLPGQTQLLDALQAGLKPHSAALAAVMTLRSALKNAGQFPAAPQIYPTPANGIGDLPKLMNNPLKGLKVEEPANKQFRLTWTGVDNLDETVETLAGRLATAFPDAADPRRLALAAIFSELSAYRTEVPILSIPAELQNNLAYRYWLIHCNQQLTKQEHDDLKGLYASPLDKNSLDRLNSDLTVLLTLDRTLADWTSVEPVTSRTDFKDFDQWHDRYDFPPPDSCVLKLLRPITADEARQLLSVKADLSFQAALRRLATGNAVAEASIGIEQIAEISTAAELPTAGSRYIVWHGAASPDQLQTLSRWQNLSTFRNTFTALSDAITTWSFQLSTDVKATDLAYILQLRLAAGAWTGLSLNPDESLALDTAIKDQALSAGAVQSLKDLKNALANGSVRVNVEDTWIPRPAIADIPAGARDALFIGRGRIRYFGLMTSQEANDLIRASGMSGPNQQAIQSLFADSMSAGLNGGKLSISARLGSAIVKSNILTTLLPGVANA